MKKIIENKIALVSINLLVMAAALLWAYHSIKNLPKYDYSLEDWKSEFAVYQNSGLSAIDEVKDESYHKEFIWGPYKPLKKGSYTAYISYTAEYDQRCIATGSGSVSELFDSSYALLTAKLNTMTYQFEVLEDVDEFQLVFSYNGFGDFTVHSISIVANSNRPKRITTEIILIILLVDCLILLLKRSKEERKTVWMLLGITALVSMPLMIYGIHNGHDLGVHYLRIEAIVQAIRGGQFPTRISSVTNYGLGYPFSIYYNDLFLYFPAFLRILGFSVDRAYKIYAILFNFLTVCISYYSFKMVFKKRDTGMILALLYTTASYRLLNIYIRGAVGEYTAQAFIPVLALALWKIYFTEAKTFRQQFGNGLLLAAGMSGVIGSHMLTTIIVCFTMLLFVLYYWKKTFTRQVFFALSMGVILTVLLNLYFMIPFVDYYFNVPTRIKKIVSEDLSLIQILGIYPGQFLSFFQDIYGHAVPNIDGRIQLTPGMSLMIAFFGGFYFYAVWQNKSTLRFLLIFSTLFLWLSSSVFPWDWLTIHFPPWNILTQVQFPSRLLVSAILFLTLLAGYILNHDKGPYMKPVFTISAVFMMIWFMSNYFDGASITYIYDASGVVPRGTGLEYLIEGSSPENIKTAVYGENMEETTILGRTVNTLSLYCRTGNNGSVHVVDAPLYAYKGYHVIDQDGNEYKYYPGIENRITFELPDGFDGNVTIVFRDPSYWRMGLYVSIITAVILCGWSAFDFRREKRISVL